MEIHRAIRQQAVILERKDAARSIMTEAVRSAHDARQSGRSVLVENHRFIERMREGRERLSEAAQLSLFDRAVEVVAGSAIDYAFKPFLDGLLRDLGLDQHPKLRDMIRNVITSTLGRMLSAAQRGEIELSDMWDGETDEGVPTCQILSRELALATAEAIPKTVLDSLLGDAPASGFALTIRQVIAKYFANESTIRMIADAFRRFVCEVSFSEIFTKGASEVQRAVSQVAGEKEKGQ